MKKITINGVETELYKANKLDLIKVYQETKNEELADHLINSYRWTLPKNGETQDECFGRLIEDYVNNMGADLERCADRMARSHRYLQSKIFELCLAYIRKLAETYKSGWYDERNQWACSQAHKIIDES